jgi:hypothetical protein
MTDYRKDKSGAPTRGSRSAVAAALVVLGTLAPSGCTSRSEAEHEQALAGISKLGGRFERDRRVDGEPIVKVDLSGRPATDADLEPLKVLTQLNSLNLGGTRVTDAGVALLASTGKLRSLDLDGARVSDAGLAHLSGLTSLRGLHLGGTGITDAGLAQLGSLSKLWVLSLSDTGISDAGLVHLRGLTKLRVLNLEGTKVTGAGIARLRKDLPQARIVAGPGGRGDSRTL